MYEQGYVENPYYHRRRHFDYVDEQTAPHQERQVINFLSQSLCSDVCLDSAISVFETLGFPPLIYVHDFVGIEVPKGERSEEHTSELQSHSDLVCRLLLEKKKENK